MAAAFGAERVGVVSKRIPSRARHADEPFRLGDMMVLFGFRDEDSFRAWRKRAEARGLPPPLTGCTRPLRWDRAQVLEWRARGGRPAQVALAESKPDAAPLDELAVARMRLRARAGMA